MPQEFADQPSRNKASNLEFIAIIENGFNMSQEQVISNAEMPRKSDNENYPHSPAYGVAQSTTKPATAIQFERVNVNGNRHFNVNFMLDEKPVAQLRELDAKGY